MQDNVTEGKPRLAPLGELDDYRVKEGNPDIRGWEAYGADSLRLGEVRELVVDTHAMKARYMIIALDRTLPNVEADRRVLVPIGRARLDDALDRVYLDDTSVATAYTLPNYDAAALASPAAERSLFGGGLQAPSAQAPSPPPVVPAPSTPAPSTPAPSVQATSTQAPFVPGQVAPGEVTPGTEVAHDRDFYNRPEYDDKRFFGRRKQDVNEAYVVLHQEQVTIEPVGDSVAVIREQVTVERYPIEAEPEDQERQRSEADFNREAPKKEPV